MRSQWGYGSPVGLDCPRSRGRVAGDEREHRRRFDNPAECRVRERGGQRQRSWGTKAMPSVSHPGGFAVWCHSDHEQNEQRGHRSIRGAVDQLSRKSAAFRHSFVYVARLSAKIRRLAEICGLALVLNS
jgi:hypothetical protein